MIVTALRSESKPMPSRETSLTTMASSDFDASFLRAFSSTFSVSAANPTTICAVFRRHLRQDVRCRFELQRRLALALDLLPRRSFRPEVRDGCRLDHHGGFGQQPQNRR